MSDILLISQKDVKSRLDMGKTIEIVEKVFQLHGNNQVLMPPKINLDTGETNDWPPYGGSYNAMPAYLGGSFDVSGLKWVWGFNDNPKRGLPYIGGVILINDPQTGELLSIMDGRYITDIRTGAATGVAAKYLAKKDSKTVGIIGAGVQGRMNLWAITTLLDIEKVHVTDLNEDTAKQFAIEMGDLLGIDVSVEKTNRDTVVDADIIVTATIANEPLVMNEWLKEGSLVVSVGSFQELDEQIPLSTKKLIVDSWAQNCHRGEMVRLIRSGKIKESSIYSELHDIIAGKKKGRENDEEKICACLIGMGSNDIAIAATLLEEIKKEKNGTPKVDLSK